MLKGHLSFRNSTCHVECAEQSGWRQGAKGALSSQESSKQPVGVDHLEGPSCPGDHQATKGAPTGLEATKRLSRRRVARKEPRSQKRRKRPPRAKRAPSTKGCRTDEGINHPGEQKVALRTKNSDGGPGRVLRGCSAEIVDAGIRSGGARVPTKRSKITPLGTRMLNSKTYAGPSQLWIVGAKGPTIHRISLGDTTVR